MSIVVTGANGHVGANLVRELVSRGESVRALVRTVGHPALAGLDVEQLQGDVRDLGSLVVAFDGADIVYHLAALISIVGDPDGQVSETNVGGAENAARAALQCGVRRFVHMSSVHAFDMKSDQATISELTPRCIDRDGRVNAYDRSKAEGERAVRRAVEDGLDAVVLHPTGVIGPYDFEPSRLGQVFLGLFERNLPSLVAGGFDFVDVRDVVNATINAAARGRTNESYLLSGRYHAISELAAAAEAVTGRAPPRFVSPMWLARVGAPFMQGMARLTNSEPLYTAEGLDALRGTALVDCSKATAELGFNARPTLDSVRDIYRWFATNGQIPSDAVLADQP